MTEAAIREQGVPQNHTSRNSRGTERRLCRICDAPVRESKSTRPADYCSSRPCRDAAGFMAALLDRLSAVDWSKGDPEVAARTRQDLQRLVNLVPCQWERPRDERGRFAAE